jgi:hypothetical protein
MVAGHASLGKIMTPQEVDEQVRAYEARLTQYAAFTQALKGLLTQLLAAKQIDVVNIEGRAKTVESFRGKTRITQIQLIKSPIWLASVSSHTN